MNMFFLCILPYYYDIKNTYIRGLSLISREGVANLDGGVIGSHHPLMGEGVYKIGGGYNITYTFQHIHILYHKCCTFTKIIYFAPFMQFYHFANVKKDL